MEVKEIIVILFLAFLFFYWIYWYGKNYGYYKVPSSFLGLIGIFGPLVGTMYLYGQFLKIYTIYNILGVLFSWAVFGIILIILGYCSFYIFGYSAVYLEDLIKKIFKIKK